MQPLLHDLVVAVAALTAALSGADGQIRAVGVQDVFHADVRVLAEADQVRRRGVRRCHHDAPPAA